MLALSGALVAAAPITPSMAKQQSRELGQLPSFPMSDGHRYVAWDDRESVTVIDTAEHSSQSVAVPDSCRFLTLGAGRLVFLCYEDSFDCGARITPVFQSLHTGESHIPPNLNGFYAQQGPREDDCAGYPNDPRGGHFTATLGTHWFTYVIGDFPYWDRWYLDWRNGGDPVAIDEGPRSIVDLDDPDGLVELCRPLHRQPDPAHDPGDADFRLPPHPYLDLYIAGRTALTINAKRNLLLRRCGTRERYRLARDIFGSWGLVRGVAWWAQPDAIHFFMTRSGRHIKQRLPGRYDQRTVVATRTRLYVTDWSTASSGQTTFVVKLPTP